MNVRHFTRASSEWIQTSIGFVAPFGPAGVAALLKKSSDTSDFEYICTAGIGADPANWQFYIGSGGDNKPSLWLGTAELKAPFTATAAEGWMVLAATKATGTTAPRFHKYVISSRTWTHQDCASTGPDSNQPLTNLMIGSSSNHSGGFLDAHIAALAIWNANINDTVVESLSPGSYADFGAMVTGWLAASTPPIAMWRFDQAAVTTAITDLAGHGADQSGRSGTTVVTNDSPTFGSPATTVRNRIDAGWMMQVLEA